MSDAPPPEDIPRDLPPLDPELAEWFDQAPPPAMPEDVWDRLSGSLAAEAAARAAAAGQVASLADARSAPARRRSAALWPILAGAAGIVLVGLVVVPVLRGGGSAPVADAPVASAEAEGAVAGEAADPVPRTQPEDDEGSQASEPSPTATSSPVVASPGAPETDPSPTEVAESPADTAPEAPGSETAPEAPGSEAAEVPGVAVPMVLATGSEYTPESMAAQITALLTGAGMAEESTLVAAMDAPSDLGAATPVGTDGFTSSPDVLRTCLDLLGATHGGAAPLVVDRALYSGQDVGVVVRLRELALGKPADLDVLVVDPACTPEDVAAAERFDLALPL